MEAKKIVVNVVTSLMLLNAVLIIAGMVSGRPYEFDILKSVVTPILCGFAVSYGERLRIRRQQKYKNLSELNA